jgi:hypothetical protein
LASISFVGYSPGASIDAAGLVTPIPEPAAWAVLLGCAALLVAARRRR